MPTIAEVSIGGDAFGQALRTQSVQDFGWDLPVADRILAVSGILLIPVFGKAAGAQ